MLCALCNSLGQCSNQKCQPWKLCKRLKNANWDTLEGSNWVQLRLTPRKSDSRISSSDSQRCFRINSQTKNSLIANSKCYSVTLITNRVKFEGQTREINSTEPKTQISLYHIANGWHATEPPWHACLSASCPGSELLKAVAMRPIRFFGGFGSVGGTTEMRWRTAQQAKGGTLKSSFFNWNHWKILVKNNFSQLLMFKKKKYLENTMISPSCGPQKIVFEPTA